MSVVGYARVSSRDQDLGVQRDKLSFCDKVFEEKVSGTKNERPKLSECLNYLREGDTLVVTKLDRLARSTFHLCQIVDKLQKKNVEFRVLDQNIDTSTPTGRLTLNVLAVIAQFETEIRKERQMEGIERAKARGVHIGGKRQLGEEQAQELKRKRKDGMLIKEIMKEYGLSKVTVYRYLNDFYEEVA